jgi:hypothetical protein
MLPGGRPPGTPRCGGGPPRPPSRGIRHPDRAARAPDAGQGFPALPLTDHGIRTVQPWGSRSSVGPPSSRGSWRPDGVPPVRDAGQGPCAPFDGITASRPCNPGDRDEVRIRFPPGDHGVRTVHLSGILVRSTTLVSSGGRPEAFWDLLRALLTCGLGWSVLGGLCRSTL